jgi:hypothetical protein
VAQKERERIQEETRQNYVLAELGQVAQAEVVEDDGCSMTRRWAFLICFVIVVLLLAATVLVFVLEPEGEETVSVRPSASPKVRCQQSLH